MDFFEYAQIASYFTTQRWVLFVVGALCFAIIFIFQSVALFIISGREGYKNRWMSFVPFFNTYYIGVCGQKNRMFKSVDTRVFSLAAAIVEALLFTGYVVYYVAQFKLADAGCIYYSSDESLSGFVTQSVYLNNVPENLAWAESCFNVLGKYVLSWVDLAFTVLQIFVLSAFFQTYSARRFFLFTLTSILFPIQGILFFILRNNKGMSYREYIRREQERQYRQYRQYSGQTFEQNPYNQNPYSSGYQQPPQDAPADPFDGERNESAEGAPSDPFSEFDKKPDDPFSEDK